MGEIIVLITVLKFDQNSFAEWQQNHAQLTALRNSRHTQNLWPL